MVKQMLAIIAGYIAIALIIMLIFTLAYKLMGADGAFKPGTYEVSALWIGVSIFTSLVAAVIGGYITTLLSRDFKAGVGLAVLLLFLGLFNAYHQDHKDGATSRQRAGDISNTEAMMNAREPLWVAVVNPILGAIGVLAGARLQRSSRG